MNHLTARPALPVLYRSMQHFNGQLPKICYQSHLQDCIPATCKTCGVVMMTALLLLSSLDLWIDLITVTMAEFNHEAMDLVL